MRRTPSIRATPSATACTWSPRSPASGRSRGSPTLARASPPRRSRASSTRSSPPSPPGSAPGSAWPSAGTSSPGLAARSGSRARWARARPSRSSCCWPPEPRLRLRTGCGGGLVLAVASALLREGFLAGEADLAGAIDGDDLHQHLVAFLEHVLHLLHPRVREVGDVHEAVRPGEDLHEGPELHDPPDGAEIGLPHLRFLRERADHLDRLLHALAIGRSDGH